MIRPAVRSRLPAACGILVTVGAGLAVRAFTDGAIAKYGGVALYATMIYFVVLFWRPGMREGRAAVLALLICWAVELAQLSPVPAALSERSRLAELALGSTFHAPDLAAYAVGVALGLLARHIIRLVSSRRGQERAAPGQ